MTNKGEGLLCPFCRSPALAMMDWQKIWAVRCNNDGTLGKDVRPCNAVGPERQTEAEAITAWNARSDGLTPSSGCVWFDLCRPCQTEDCSVCPSRTQPPASEDVVLPCDVKLPPATTIAAGCKVSTLLSAINDPLRPAKFDKSTSEGLVTDAAIEAGFSAFCHGACRGGTLTRTGLAEIHLAMLQADSVGEQAWLDAGFDVAVAAIEGWALGFIGGDTRRKLEALASDLKRQKVKLLSRAALQAQPAADVEGQIPKAAEAICVAMAAAQAANIPVGSDQWFHDLGRAALSTAVIRGGE